MDIKPGKDQSRAIVVVENLHDDVALRDFLGIERWNLNQVFYPQRVELRRRQLGHFAYNCMLSPVATDLNYARQVLEFFEAQSAKGSIDQLSLLPTSVYYDLCQ